MQSQNDEEELDLSSGMVPHHNLGPVTGYDHDTGLPIVKRKTADTSTEKSEETPAKPEAKPEKPEPKSEPKEDAKPKPDTKAPALQKGSPVTLPDGSKGKVMHMVANMGTVRVRTDDGRNLTVRAKALTVAPHIMVATHARRLPQ